MIRTYDELITLPTFEERLEYLRLSELIGQDTFGFDRYLNQNFYKSAEWKRVRDIVIVRDNACDLGLPGYEIGGRIYVHHMNPLKPSDIKNSTDYLLDPNFLICVTKDTHDAIHFGTNAKEYVRKISIVERKPNDTKIW